MLMHSKVIIVVSLQQHFCQVESHKGYYCIAKPLLGDHVF